MNDVSEKLNKAREIMAATIPLHLIDQQVELSTTFRFSRDEIRIRLSGYIWGEYQESLAIQYAANGWQLFKEQHLPLWLLKLSPVQYREKMVIPKVVYPTLRDPEIELEKIKAVMVSTFPREMTDKMDMATLERWAKGESETFGNDLEIFIWGQSQDFVTITYPLNGWQALKEKRWFPAWLRDRYPVRYNEKTLVTADEIYDQLKISLPDETHRVILHRASRIKEKSWRCYRNLMNSSITCFNGDDR